MVETASTDEMVARFPEGYVSRRSLMIDESPLEDFDRLTQIEQSSGYKAGTRFSFEGKRVFEVAVHLESGEFLVVEGLGDPVSLTAETYGATSGLCYWKR